VAFDLVLTRYALERFLARLAGSDHAYRFVLKGAMLVTTWIDDPLRGTRDLDLLGFGDPDPGKLSEIIAEIMAIEQDDGLRFDHGALTARAIREDNAYGGVGFARRQLSLPRVFPSWSTSRLATPSSRDWRPSNIPCCLICRVHV